jgi:phenylalanyl-tRNA synthetase beta chain
MKVSFNWLKQYISTDLDAVTVGEILTDIGLEVEKTTESMSIKGGLEGLIIGEVLTKEPHPDADRLNITTVNIGGEPQQIVCGAPNVAVGQKVVVAIPGTVLYTEDGEAFKIKKSKIRGVESLGMICGPDEIGFGGAHDGIMVLDAEAIAGTPAPEYFKVEKDTQIEIGLTPNRADAMGHIGVARDLLAAFKYKGITPKDINLTWPDTSKFKVENNHLPIKIEVLNSEACPRYCGVSISGIKVEESPEWLQNKLRSIDLSPINNIVDITNFVLHEYGQPLHAFDADKIEGGKVIVKTVAAETKFTTLDDTERSLHEEDLIIANGSEGMCIAGVFGGTKSGITNDTVNVFLESAYFNPVSVRKTAKRHGLNTDASFRFERGIDPNLTVEALKRAALLIKEVAGGTISSEITDLYPNPIKNFKFSVNKDRIGLLCGVDFKENEIEDILSYLEIEVLATKGTILELEVPAYRVDVQREADIAEEVLRIYGFNNVPIPEKLNTSISYRPKLDKEKHQNYISDWLASVGYFESMSNSLTKSGYVDIAKSDNIKEEFSVKMLNPLSTELDVMRQTLLFNALEAVRLNQNYGTENVKLFEFGKIYQKFETGYNEERHLSIVISGRVQEELWNGNNDKVSFYNIKGITEGVLNRLGIWKNGNITATDNQLLEDGLTYKIAKKKVADIGWVRSDIKSHFGLRNDVFVALVNWDVVLELMVMNKVKFKELTKFPAVKRDLSLLLDDSITFEEIETIAKKCDRKLLKEVSLFDVYKGKNMEKGKKSYALRFILQDENKTLKDKEIEKVMHKIQTSITEQLKAELR